MTSHTLPAAPRVSQRFSNAEIIALAQQHGFTRKTENDMGMASWNAIQVAAGDGTTVTIDEIHPLYQHAIFTPDSPDWEVITNTPPAPPSMFSRLRQTVTHMTRP
jgi:hypothetical protein